MPKLLHAGDREWAEIVTLRLVNAPECRDVLARALRASHEEVRALVEGMTSSPNSQLAENARELCARL